MTEEKGIEHGGASEKEAMKAHYEHYAKLAADNKLTEEDKNQWQLAQQRKDEGLID